MNNSDERDFQEEQANGREMIGEVADQDRACCHPDFVANVEVARITKSDDDQAVIAYSATITVACMACGERFRWTGVPAGLLPTQPTCSVDETELIAPCRPASADPDFGMGIPGYSIRCR